MKLGLRGTGFLHEDCRAFEAIYEFYLVFLLDLSELVNSLSSLLFKEYLLRIVDFNELLC